MSPVSRCSSGTCAKIGIASSAPSTAIGTIGTPARIAVRTKPPRPVALPEQLARALLALREDEHEPALVAQQPLRVGRMGGDQPELVDQHRHARIALEPVLAEHV